MEAEKRNYYYLKIVGYFLLLMGLIMLISTIFNYFSTGRFIDRSQVTTGIVILNKVMGTGTLLQEVSYIEYYVDDKSYECHNTWGGPGFSYQVGDTVSIRYDIMDPRKAFVNDTNNLYWSSKGLIGFAILFLTLGGLGVFSTNFLLNIFKHMRAGY